MEKFKFSQILLGDKNANSLCSKNISTLNGVVHLISDIAITNCKERLTRAAREIFLQTQKWVEIVR